MNDMRLGETNRHCLTTFIVGNRYATVYHSPTYLFTDVIAALEEHFGELKKPFVVLSQSYIYADELPQLVDRELLDIVLE